MTNMNTVVTGTSIKALHLNEDGIDTGSRASQAISCTFKKNKIKFYLFMLHLPLNHHQEKRIFVTTFSSFDPFRQ